MTYSLFLLGRVQGVDSIDHPAETNQTVQTSEADPVFLDTELGQNDGPGRTRKWSMNRELRAVGRW